MEKLHSLFNIAELIAKEKVEGLSESERAALDQWLSVSEKNRQRYNHISAGMLINELDELKKFNSRKAYKKIRKSLPDNEAKKYFIPVYARYAAAIAVIIVSVYIVVKAIHPSAPELVAQNNIVPGRQKAILITSGNREIVIDNTGNKQITGEQATIIQNGSTLVYNKDSAAITKPAFNTLITPRGGEYSVVLSDGTEVMLNAESRLTYPVVFSGNIREVTLEGEAFFKVAKSQTSSFIVKANKVNVTVYGTVFDVSAYDNETLVQTTLLEGSVGISLNNGTDAGRLRPGQQHTYCKDNGSSAIKEVQMDSYIAWTKGKFVFENEPVEHILMALSRWYDFEYDFKDDKLKNQRFTLSIGRYDKVSEIFDMMANSSDVKFVIDAKKVLVCAK